MGHTLLQVLQRISQLTEKSEYGISSESTSYPDGRLLALGLIDGLNSMSYVWNIFIKADSVLLF